MPVSQEHNFSQITDVALDNIIRDVLTLGPQSDGCPNAASTIHCHYLSLDSNERWLHLQASITFSLSDNLCKSGPLHFGSENQFPSNFTHETILV